MVTLESPTIENWLALRIFDLYRLIIAITLLALVHFNLNIHVFEITQPFWYKAYATLYLCFSMISIVQCFLHLPKFTSQVNSQIILDVIFLTILLYTTSGIDSGLWILFVAVIAGGSILTAGRTSLFFAAIASLAIIVGYLHTHHLDLIDLRQLGIIGSVLFATALLGYSLSRQIRKSEHLARQQQIKMRHQQILNQHIIERLTAGIIVLDQRFELIMMNNSAAQLLGISEYPPHMPLVKIAHELQTELDQWDKQKEYDTKPIKISNTGLEIVAHIMNLFPNESQEKYHTEPNIVIFLDNASRMSQRAQKEKLEALGRLTASVAHEIRNPLGAISHASQLLREVTNQSDDTQQLSKIINEQTKRINNIIVNIQSLSKPKLKTPTKFLLKPFLEELYTNYQFEGAQAEIDITIEPSDTEIIFDKSQLAQILINLSDNGLRYSQKNTGKPTLKIGATQPSEHHRMILDILDQGPGVEPTVAKQVFEPFYTTESTGTGLGLFIAKELCEMNQASLEILPCDTGGYFRITF